MSAHATDTQWFQGLWDAVICFTHHRIHFDSPHRDSHQATGGHTFAYFGPEPEAFAREFEAFGAIVAR